MKMKFSWLGALFLGLAAGALRVVQYFTVIDGEGYYLSSPLASVLSGLLLGPVVIGVLWSFAAGWKQKETLLYTELFPQKIGVLMVLMALLSGAEFALRMAAATHPLARLSAIAVLLGAAAWLLWGIFGERMPAALGLLPILQAGVTVVVYFWDTYKYIQVSEYRLTLLALSFGCLLILLIMKALAGAECRRGRLTTAACLVLVFGIPSYLPALAGEITPLALLRIGQGVLLTVLAILILKRLSTPAAPPAPAEGPDLSALNEYIDNIPEVEDENNENT